MKRSSGRTEPMVLAAVRRSALAVRRDRRVSEAHGGHQNAAAHRWSVRTSIPLGSA